MNRVFSQIWSKKLNALIVVHENARRDGKGRRGRMRRVAPLSLTLLCALSAPPVLGQALPAGGQVISGQATIHQSGGAMVIDQASRNMIANWQSFDIGKGNSVTFNQPSADATALNRVVGQDPSRVLGSLKANGNVFLVNPNGILFGAGAQVDVGGLVASTLDIADADFLRGDYRFWGEGGDILNQGELGGSVVALIAPVVRNEGTIIGDTALAAGTDVTLDFNGDGLISVTVDASTLATLVENKGLIRADDGLAVLTARGRNAAMTGIVNNQGIVEARGVKESGGRIYLIGDMEHGVAHVGGRLDASADRGDGGFIETSAARVNVADGARITTKAAGGQTGTWLVDPVDFIIARTGGDMTGETLSNQLADNNVTIESVNGAGGTDGNIYVNDVVTWADTKLTLHAENDIEINSLMVATGTGGLALEYGQASAGGGASEYRVHGQVDLESTGSFSTKLGSAGTVVNYTIVTELGVENDTSTTSLQGMKNNLSGNYVLGSHIDAGGTRWWAIGFTPIGDNSRNFNGQFDGLGHVIQWVDVYNPSGSFGGLFGAIGRDARVANLGLDGFTVDVSRYAGILAGRNRGTVYNVYAEGSVNGTSNSLGGLVGDNWGTISNSYADARVRGTGYAAVSIGGFAGANYGHISKSYAVGRVEASDTVGGMVGNNAAEGSLENVHSSVQVIADWDKNGGLVGENAGTIVNGYYDMTSSGRSDSGKGVGIADGYSAAGYAGFDFANDWYLIEGETRPFLRSEHSQVIRNAHQFQLMHADYSNSASYVMSRNIWYFDDLFVWSMWQPDLGFFPLGSSTTPFAAHFDGRGHYLRGVHIMRPETDRVGIFSVIDSPFFGNFGVELARVEGRDWVGSLAGEARSSLSNVYANGQGAGSATVSGRTMVGGLVGANAGSMEAAWSRVEVTGSSVVGGLIGVNNGTLDEAYANGAVTGSSNSGILAGRNNGTITASFVNAQGGLPAVGDGSSTGITEVTPAFLKSRSDLKAAGWDMNDRWGIRTTANDSFVVLQVFHPDFVFLRDITLNLGDVTQTYGDASGPSGWSFSGCVGCVSDLQWGSAVSGIGSYAYDAADVLDFTFTRGTRSDYIIDFGGGGVTITPRTISLADLVIEDKVYDRSTAATLTSARLANAVDGDDVDFVFDDASFASRNVGVHTVTVNGVTLTGSKAGNYIIAATATGSGKITPRDITITGVTAMDKVYDGNRDAVISGGAISAIAGDDVILSAGGASGQFADRHAGENKTVVISGFAIGGDDAGNYNLVQPGEVTANITPKALDISGSSVADKIYDATTSATVTAGTLTGIIGSDSVTVSGSGSFADRHVGAGKDVAVLYSLSGADAGNYSITGEVLTASITPRAISISGAAAANRVYDGTRMAAVSGGEIVALGDDAVTLSDAGATGLLADKDAGMAKAVTVSGYVLSGADANNYTLIQPVGLTADITPKALAISGSTAADKIYDATTAATVSAGTLAGIIDADSVTVSASGSFADKHAGIGKNVTVLYSLSGADAANYRLAGETLTASITPKALAITGSSAVDKIYDATRAATVTAGTLTGVIGGDNVSVGASGTFADKNAGTGKDVTVLYDLSGSDAGNYSLAGEVVTADITAKTIAISGSVAADKIYDGGIRADVTAGALLGVIGDDAVDVAAAGDFADRHVGADKAVTVAYTLSGTDAGNYILAGETLTADITPLAINITDLAAESRVYDGTTRARLTGGVIAPVADDNVTLDFSGMTAVFADRHVGTGKAVTVAGILLQGADAGNYSLLQPAGLTADITPATLTIAGGFTAEDKIYDATRLAAVNLDGLTLHGILGADEVGLNLTGATGYFSDKNVGLGKTVTLSATSSLTGPHAGNYQLTGGLPTGTAAITPATLTIAGGFTVEDKVYDATRLAAVNLDGLTLRGILADDEVSLHLAGATGYFSDKNVGVDKTVTLSATSSLTGTHAGNYQLAGGLPTGTAAITPATLTVRGLVIDDKMMDGTAAASIVGFGRLDGIIGADAVMLDLTRATASFADNLPGQDKPVSVSGLALSGDDAGNYLLLLAEAPTASINSAEKEPLPPSIGGAEEGAGVQQAAALAAPVLTSGFAPAEREIPGLTSGGMNIVTTIMLPGQQLVLLSMTLGKDGTLTVTLPGEMMESHDPSDLTQWAMAAAQQEFASASAQIQRVSFQAVGNAVQ